MLQVEDIQIAFEIKLDKENGKAQKNPNDNTDLQPNNEFNVDKKEEA